MATPSERLANYLRQSDADSMKMTFGEFEGLRGKPSARIGPQVRRLVEQHAAPRALLDHRCLQGETHQPHQRPSPSSGWARKPQDILLSRAAWPTRRASRRRLR